MIRKDGKTGSRRVGSYYSSKFEHDQEAMPDWVRQIVDTAVELPW